jgi:hypothetical protein
MFQILLAMVIPISNLGLLDAAVKRFVWRLREDPSPSNWTCRRVPRERPG